MGLGPGRVFIADHFHVLKRQLEEKQTPVEVMLWIFVA